MSLQRCCTMCGSDYQISQVDFAKENGQEIARVESPNDPLFGGFVPWRLLIDLPPAIEKRLEIHTPHFKRRFEDSKTPALNVSRETLLLLQNRYNDGNDGPSDIHESAHLIEHCLFTARDLLSYHFGRNKGGRLFKKSIEIANEMTRQGLNGSQLYLISVVTLADQSLRWRLSEIEKKLQEERKFLDEIKDLANERSLERVMFELSRIATKSERTVHAIKVMQRNGQGHILPHSIVTILYRVHDDIFDYTLTKLADLYAVFGFLEQDCKEKLLSVHQQFKGLDLRKKIVEDYFGYLWQSESLKSDEVIDCWNLLYENGADTFKASPHAQSENHFGKIGDIWSIAFEGKHSILKHGLGLYYVAFLLQNQGESFGSIEIERVFADSQHDNETSNWYNSMTGEQLERENLRRTDIKSIPNFQPADNRARREYLDEIQKIDKEIDEIETNHDLSKSERLEELREQREALSKAIGHRFFTRTNREVERSRDRVRKSINRQIKRVAKVLPELGKHLGSQIQAGVNCSYSPPNPVDWEISY